MEKDISMPETELLGSSAPGPVIFQVGGQPPHEWLRIEPDGRAFVNGTQVATDQEAYRLLREWLVIAMADPAVMMNRLSTLSAQNAHLMAERDQARQMALQCAVTRSDYQTERDIARDALTQIADRYDAFSDAGRIARNVLVPVAVDKKPSRAIERTERGFAIYGYAPSRHGGKVRVQESSLALAGAHVWLFLEDMKCTDIGGEHNSPAPQLSVPAAKQLIAALQAFVDDAEEGHLTEPATP